MEISGQDPLISGDPTEYLDDQRSIYEQHVSGNPAQPTMSRTQSWVHPHPEFKSTISYKQDPILKRTAHSLQPMKNHALHMAIIYSDPMVENNVKSGHRIQQCQTMNEPVNFQGESAAILECLDKKEKKLRVHIECATIDQCVSILKKEKPRILHVMCHGDYDADKKEYYLQFENEKAELFKLYPSTVKELFSQTDFSETKLIFINACHSEMVGRAFLELGVDCVIVAQSQLKIDDEFAKKFSELFYDELISPHSIRVAFDSAKTQLKATSGHGFHSCCCGHKHKPNCAWVREFLNKVGKNFAHERHLPLCQCPNRASHRHKSVDCDWADTFLLDHDCYDPMMVGDEVLICCCSPELTHDETMKLLLLERQEGISKDTWILDDLVPGKLEQKRKFHHKFRDCTTIGRNKVIYDIFKAFSTQKCDIVYLCGQSGSGKTVLSKHIANYMMERHKIADAEYRNHDKIASVVHILAHLPDAQSKGSKEGKETLFILDNMDTALENRFEELHQGLREVLQRLNLKFLILCSRKNLIKPLEGLSGREEMIFDLKPLNTVNSATLLLQMIEQFLPWTQRSVAALHDHPICSQGCTPKLISEIAHRVRNGKTLDIICEELNSKRQAFGKDDDLLDELKINELSLYLM